MEQNYLEANAILGLIKDYYPGGQEAFVSEGGDAHLLPWKELLIHIPDGGEKLREALNKAKEQLKVTITYVEQTAIDLSQFQDEDEEAALQRVIIDLATILMPFNAPVSTVVQNLYVGIQVNSTKVDEDLLKALSKHLVGVTWLRRVLVAWEGGHKWLINRDTPKVVLETTTNDKPIGDEEIDEIKRLLSDDKAIDDMLKGV